MQADYTKQLTEIAHLLRQPAIPTWAVALIGAALGALLTFAGQVLLRFIDNWWEVRRHRRVLYRDVAGIFLAIAGAEHYESEKDARQALTMDLHFDGEEYLRRDQKLYMQLPERYAANEIYAYAHQVLNTDHSVRGQAYGAAVHIARCIWDHKLDVKYFKRFLDKSELNTLLTKSKEIYEDYAQQESQFKNPPSHP